MLAWLGCIVALAINVYHAYLTCKAHKERDALSQRYAELYERHQALCRGLVEWGRAIQARNYPARHVLSGRN